ncbi:MAG: hypothetical protein FJ104_07755 [Deltaproteobacteria bacterium]|nr:hypothetical protein [Deltaproteobacteria bacterium]
MALREEFALDLREHRNPRGTARLWTLTPTLYVTHVTGAMDGTHADLFERYGQERIDGATGPLVVFHDWLDMTGYTSECRTRLTRWSLARRNVYADVHLAVRSKLVAMGVEVANLALGGLIRTHGSRASLEAALALALRPPGDLPPPARGSR